MSNNFAFGGINTSLILLRQALGQLLGVAPQAVVLAEQPGAAPLLESPRCAGAGLSISHSGPWVAVAASASVPLGLDIEVLDPARAVDALAAQAFDAQRLAWWQARPASTRRRDFYAQWCAQEARIKLGRGSGECVTLPHDELAIVLCCAVRTPQPLCEIITLTIT
jgi:4'-phosphopantetheinyl transferase